jgi:hypothetical protein
MITKIIKPADSRIYMKQGKCLACGEKIQIIGTRAELFREYRYRCMNCDMAYITLGALKKYKGELNGEDQN